MTEIRVLEEHALGREEARDRLRKFEEALERYRFKVDWQEFRGELLGTGASGHVDVQEESVEIFVKLGVMAKLALASSGNSPEKVEEWLRRKLAQILAGAS